MMSDDVLLKAHEIGTPLFGHFSNLIYSLFDSPAVFVFLKSKAPAFTLFVMLLLDLLINLFIYSHVLHPVYLD